MSEELQSGISVDNVIFGFDNDQLNVLLIKRGNEPFKGKWALPGDLVRLNEDIDHAVVRVLEELTGLKNVYLSQVGAFGKPDRHPIGRVVTIAYYSLVNIRRSVVTPASFAFKAQWHPVEKVGELAFDHNEILNSCLNALRRELRIKPIGFELLPAKFTLSQLQSLYEGILNRKLDKRNFRKKVVGMDLLVDLDVLQEGVAHRPAKLYQFDLDRYQELAEEGISFELKESKNSEPIRKTGSRASKLLSLRTE